MWKNLHDLFQTVSHMLAFIRRTQVTYIHRSEYMTLIGPIIPPHKYTKKKSCFQCCLVNIA